MCCAAPIVRFFSRRIMAKNRSISIPKRFFLRFSANHRGRFALFRRCLLLWFVYLVVLHRSVVRAQLFRWVVMGVVTLLTLMPLALFFVTHPNTFNVRSGAVFTPEDIVLNGERVARGFFLIGDSEPKDDL